jgi:hypothetical protein
MESPGFRTTLVRGTEWAATGSVTVDPPDELAVPDYEWRKSDGRLELAGPQGTVWRFVFDPEKGSKPFFHPLALPTGEVLTWSEPADHVWHYGLWFSWKYINGVNYWEENRQTRKSDGLTSWSPPNMTTRDDFSATIELNLSYQVPDSAPVLSETRIVEISAPDANGQYYLDWTSTFTVESDTPVVLDRTPLPHEKDGKIWGRVRRLVCPSGRGIQRPAAGEHGTGSDVRE